jgi:energy-coupling factor transporter ATP-binding protein EcfA2
MPAVKTAGPLRPVELASAAVLGSLAAVLTVAGWFLPHLGVIAAVAVVPLGLVSYHHRFRALAAATFAAAVLSFLVAGTGSVTNVVECAAVGGLVGMVKRRRWGVGAVVAGVAVIGPALAAVSDGLLWLFSSLRRLTLQQVRNTWISVRHLLLALPGSAGEVRGLDSFVNQALRYWWISIAVIVVAATAWFALLGWIFLGAVLERLEWSRPGERLEPEPVGPLPAPVPVRLVSASFRYPEADRDALAPTDLDLVPGEMLAVVGDNGSGKSTLVRLLAGRPPTGGRVERAGAAGLGRPGGTALVMQHPETQVLGVRVADDVVWGLPDPGAADVDGLLEAVGLAGFGPRETSGLSGGELQRLAVAAALARRPALLLSDESTSMVDAQGREELVALLRRLPAAVRMTVVHVTHRAEEATVADRRLVLEAPRPPAGRRPPTYGGGREPVGAPAGGGAGEPVGAPAGGGAGEPVRAPVGSGSGEPVGAPAGGGAPRLELAGVAHTYSLGTPWATPALFGIDLAIEPGEGVLVVGGNGSGKTTLAWVMAGLLRPSFGACRLGGVPVHTQVGAVGLAFQHARLQLQRPTVAQDVRSAGGCGADAAAAALAAVGLDPAEVGDRPIEALSGGQQRRVALAGLLARRPSVLVLDEPLAGLDGPSRRGLLTVLSSLRRHQGITIVVISHDLHGVEQVCDRVVRLEAGRLLAGPPVRAAAG